jgi:hypothetical protein
LFGLTKPTAVRIASPEKGSRERVHADLSRKKTEMMQIKIKNG